MMGLAQAGQGGQFRYLRAYLSSLSYDHNNRAFDIRCMLMKPFTHLSLLAHAQYQLLIAHARGTVHIIFGEHCMHVNKRDFS